MNLFNLEKMKSAKHESSSNTNDINNNLTKPQILAIQPQSSSLETTITIPCDLLNELDDLIKNEFNEYKKLNDNANNLENRLDKLEEKMSIRLSKSNRTHVTK
jgi:uncharacterized coiled-coil protein SlyX